MAPSLSAPPGGSGASASGPISPSLHPFRPLAAVRDGGGAVGNDQRGEMNGWHSLPMSFISAPPRMRRASISIALAIAFSLSPSLAHADDSPLRARFAEGTAAFEKRDFAAAVDAFGDVYKATGATKHLWNLALAEYEAKRPFAAWGHLRDYLAKPDANPKNVARAHKLIAELDPKIGHLRINAPDGAEITLDGARVGAAPLAAPVDVDPDAPHVVVARHGDDVAKQDVAPTGGKSVAIDLAFPAPPPTPVVAPPTSPASAPPAPAEPPRASIHTALSDVSSPSPSRHGSHLRTWMTVGLGVGALALAGSAVYMGIQSNDDKANADRIRSTIPLNACPNAAHCNELQDAISSQESHHTASMILYGGAGVFAAGAVASFLLLPRGDSPARSGAFVPVLGAQVAGAAYAGVF